MNEPSPATPLQVWDRRLGGFHTPLRGLQTYRACDPERFELQHGTARLLVNSHPHSANAGFWVLLDANAAPLQSGSKGEVAARARALWKAGLGFRLEHHAKGDVSVVLHATNTN